MVEGLDRRTSCIQPQLQLEVVSLCDPRPEMSVLAPIEEHLQVGLGMRAGHTPVSGQVPHSRKSEACLGNRPAE